MKETKKSSVRKALDLAHWRRTNQTSRKRASSAKGNVCRGFFVKSESDTRPDARFRNGVPGRRVARAVVGVWCPSCSTRRNEGRVPHSLGRWLGALGAKVVDLGGPPSLFNVAFALGGWQPYEQRRVGGRAGRLTRSRSPPLFLPFWRGQLTDRHWRPAFSHTPFLSLSSCAPRCTQTPTRTKERCTLSQSAAPFRKCWSDIVRADSSSFTLSPRLHNLEIQYKFSRQNRSR